MSNYKFETLAIHSGFSPEEDSNFSCAVPLHRTSAYKFKNAEHARDLFDLKKAGNIYSRIGSPTQGVLEKRLCDLENGVGALALASGTNAIFYTVLNLCHAGDEILSSSLLYGGTHTMFKSILPDYGITTNYFDIHNIDSLSSLINKNTKAVFVETIGNPSLEIADIEKLAEAAHSAGIPLIVDSTFTTPYLLQPGQFGADIVIHSLTKWIGGHGTAIGGAVIDTGNFDFNNEKFDNFSKPDSSYHGLTFGKDIAKSDSPFITRMRVVPLRNLGGCISPDNCWIFLQGLETLHLRMERHSENALKCAEFLKKHNAVEWVRYPGLDEDNQPALAEKYLPRGRGGMVVFGIKGGFSSGAAFIDNVKMITHLANVGDAKSLAIHPASTTHSQLSNEELQKSGISENMIRLSIGIENIEDIIQDIENALELSV